VKRILNIKAVNGGTTAKVRIEVECRWRDEQRAGTRYVSGEVLNQIADDVMLALSEASYLNVPVCRQCVGR
jgi:hypothetical protein